MDKALFNSGKDDCPNAIKTLAVQAKCGPSNDAKDMENEKDEADEIDSS